MSNTLPFQLKILIETKDLYEQLARAMQNKLCFEDMHEIFTQAVERISDGYTHSFNLVLTKLRMLDLLEEPDPTPGVIIQRLPTERGRHLLRQFDGICLELLKRINTHRIQQMVDENYEKSLDDETPGVSSVVILDEIKAGNVILCLYTR